MESSKITVTSINVVNTGGSDKIFFESTLPNPIWPYTGTATLKMESAVHKTDEFLLTNFPGVPVKKIKG